MGYLVPILLVPDLEEAMRFYTAELGFKEWFVIRDTQGRAVSGGLERGEARVMFDHVDALSAADWRKVRADDLGTVTQGVVLYLDVGDEDLDAFYQRVRSRAKVVEPIADRFWGDRVFTVEDPAGYRVQIARHVRDMSDAERSERAREAWARRS